MMSKVNLRPLLVALVFANLAFAAWALLIDRPEQVPAARDISHLLPLQLASEPLPGSSAPASAPLAPVVAPAVVAQVPSGPRCVTVGPFGDMVVAAAADATLQGRGFSPKQRNEPSRDQVLYWVYIDRVPSDAAAADLLQKLRSSGLADAHVMPADSAADPRRVSVGLFNEHAGAERRSNQVKALGLSPVIDEQRQGHATYWIDLSVPAGIKVTTDGLPPGNAGARLEVRDCPALASSASAAPSAP